MADGDYRLPPEIQQNLYRLTQEALHNIAKHAQARHVRVEIETRGREFVLVVRDDGRGFSVDETAERSIRGGLGLTSMRERAALVGGILTIDSAASRGTTVLVRIPAIPSVDDTP